MFARLDQSVPLDDLENFKPDRGGERIGDMGGVEEVPARMRLFLDLGGRHHSGERQTRAERL